MSLSMVSPKEVSYRAASYFERKGLNEKAVRLYVKAGALKKASTLAERSGISGIVPTEVPEQDDDEEDLMAGGNKVAISSRITQLVESGKYERAVPLLISVGQYERALDLCIQHNVPIQQSLVRKILPDQEPVSSGAKAKRTELTRIVAEKCREQGSF